jgi:L-asparaginase
VQWLEGSPTVEETIYWLNLLIDIKVPIVAHSAQRMHGTASSDGPRNILDGIKYLLSGIALDPAGRDRVGAVLIVDELVYSAREVTKVDGRPGGYETVGGHGGIVADMGGASRPQLTFVPARKHTYLSDVRMTGLSGRVDGVTGSMQAGIRRIDVDVLDDRGTLRPSAMPRVTFTRFGRYGFSEVGDRDEMDLSDEVEIRSRIEANLHSSPLAGFVAEGQAPFGITDTSTAEMLAVATYSGMPVVCVARGNTGGMASRYYPVFISGNNLSATKARMLLMAALLKLGALPVAADVFHPTPEEIHRTRMAVARYCTSRYSTRIDPMPMKGRDPTRGAFQDPPGGPKGASGAGISRLRSRVSAAWSRSASAKRRAISWTPVGRPLGVRPVGTEVAG